MASGVGLFLASYGSYDLYKLYGYLLQIMKLIKIAGCTNNNVGCWCT